MEDLTMAQIENCRRIFSLFDINKDNCISAEELGRVLRGLGLNPSLAEIDSMVSQVDVEGQGVIQFPEFLRLYAQKIKEPITEEDVAKYFLLLDRDGNGMIDAQEFRRIITTMGEALKEEEADKILEEADKDGNGYIDYNEFKKVLLESV